MVEQEESRTSRRLNNKSIEIGSQPLRSKNNNSSTKHQMLEGSVWMTVGSIFSRILGAIYIIPWVMWFGSYSNQANSLYTKGYNIYSFFLIAAIAGIPASISKQIAHYNTLNEFSLGYKLYRHALILSVGTGVVCASLLFWGAPVLDGGDVNVIPVLHSLAWAVLIIPTMSLTRGFFQGYQEMGPSAISQIVEQIARVAYMLLTAFIIMGSHHRHANWIFAVSQSTFAACIGAIGSLMVLGWYYLKYRERLIDLRNVSANKIEVPTTQLYREIISQAVPFIIIASSVIIFQLVDQYTFFNIMRAFHNYSNSFLNTLYAIFAFNANKLVMIVLSLASAMGITVIPLLSKAKSSNDKNKVGIHVTEAIQLFAFVMFPSALGLVALAKPAYTLFYNFSGTGTAILEFTAYISIIIGFESVTGAIMQSLGETMLAVKYFTVGLIAKFILQIPLVLFLSADGALLSTAIGFIIINYLVIKYINNKYSINYQTLKSNFSKIILYSLIMLFISYMSTNILYLFLNQQSKVLALIVCCISAGFGGCAYIYLALKSRLADDVLGSRVMRLRKIFKIA